MCPVVVENKLDINRATPYLLSKEAKSYLIFSLDFNNLMKLNTDN